jgi:hypothetical protein
MIDLRTVVGSQVSLAGLAPITSPKRQQASSSKKEYRADNQAKEKPEIPKHFNLTVTRLPNLNLFLETPYAGVARMPVSLHIL